MILTNWISKRAHTRKRTTKRSAMSILLSRAKDKLSGDDKGSNGGSPTRSPIRSPIRSSRNSTAGRVIPPEPVQQQVDGDFSHHDTERILQLHNLARASRRCKKLEWDSSLAKDAETYAQTLASTGIMEHSGIGAQGENLFVSDGDASFEDAVDSWLNEEKKYHGELIGEGNLADWGHFSE